MLSLSLPAVISLLLACPVRLALCRPLAAPLKRSSNGPVISTNFQDPSIIQVGKTWYGFAGANGNPPGINIQIATSSDFETWSVAGGYDALPVLGAWAANPGHVWAPDVAQLSSGEFIMYYSAVTAESPSQHCIGAATSPTIQGPYTPAEVPLFCNLAAGGAIDPNAFVDPVSRTQWVVYKVDGNSVGHGGLCKNSVAPIVPTPILLQQVSAEDGVTLIGPSYELVVNSASDGPAVEAPALVYTASSKTYTLFYSSGCYTNSAYKVRYATAQSLTGPYYTNPDPLLVTGDTPAHIYIPGGVDVSPDGSRMVFQGDLNLAWFDSPPQGERVRGMYVSTLGNLGTWNIALSLV